MSIPRVLIDFLTAKLPYAHAKPYAGDNFDTVAVETISPADLTEAEIKHLMVFAGVFTKDARDPLRPHAAEDIPVRFRVDPGSEKSPLLPAWHFLVDRQAMHLVWLEHAEDSPTLMLRHAAVPVDKVGAVDQMQHVFFGGKQFGVPADTMKEFRSFVENLRIVRDRGTNHMSLVAFNAIGMVNRRESGRPVFAANLPATTANLQAILHPVSGGGTTYQDLERQLAERHGKLQPAA